MQWPKVTGLDIYRAVFWGILVVALSEVLTGKFADAFMSLVQMGMVSFIAPDRALLEKL
jgi:hypothetical protein